jgi:predicted DNA-binding protein YlxM (UPF0122 family)/very-short-patch-repair endonuclease
MESQTHQIIEDYQNGKQLKILAREHDCSVDKIRWLLQKNNVWKPAKPRKCSIDEQQVIQWYTQDLSITEIASRVGTSTQPIVTVLNKHKIRKPVKFKELSYKNYLIAINKASFVDLVNEHITQSNIMKALDCGQSMVVSLCKLHDITLHNSSTGKSLLSQKNAQYPLTKQVVEDLYYNKRIPLTHIGKLVGVSTGYLRKHVKMWGIKTEGTDIRLSAEFNDLKNDDDVKDILTNMVNNMSLTEICSTFGIGKDTFEKLIKSQSVSFPTKYRSAGEQQVEQFVRSIVGEDIIICDRQIIHPQELDIVIPNHKIAIEYCGLYWHSDAVKDDRYYHVKKLEKCRERGYKLLTIFEDEWINSPETVKSKISHILEHSNSLRINARQCNIRSIEAYQKNSFLNQFHIQGADKAKVSLGLFFDEELIAVMTFSAPSHLKGGKNKINGDGSWELNRFATNSKYVVRGAAGKLLTHFKKNHNWTHIYSYADRRWSTGNLYEQLGFTLTSYSKPNYWYIQTQKVARLYRYNFKKSNLVSLGFDPNKTEFEIMKERGYHKLWDCGTIRFDIWKK